jgi:ABC-2 type transport system ATP-binding protein
MQPDADPPAIEASGLTKRFGSFTAVDDFDLLVKTGTVVSLLGPNGAGKTTTVRMLATLARPDAGHARIAGHDIVTEAEQVRSLHRQTGPHTPPGTDALRARLPAADGA